MPRLNVQPSGDASRRAVDILADIYAAHPDSPSNAAPRAFDLRDRQSVRRAIVSKLRDRA